MCSIVSWGSEEGACVDEVMKPSWVGFQKKQLGLGRTFSREHSKQRSWSLGSFENKICSKGNQPRVIILVYRTQEHMYGRRSWTFSKRAETCP